MKGHGGGGEVCQARGDFQSCATVCIVLTALHEVY